MLKGYKELEEGLKESLLSRMYILDTLTDTMRNDTLEGILIDLENKEDKTDIEEATLSALQAIIQEEAYIDEATRNEFKEAVHLIIAAEAMKDLLEGVDFTIITKALNDLTHEQRALYNEYLSLTTKTYRLIESILGINVDEELLPDEYLHLAKLSADARRKIVVDLTLKKLDREKKDNLSESEKKALEIYGDTLLPFQRQYKEALKTALEKFVFGVRKAIMEAAPVSLLKDKEEFKALVILDAVR
jgi:hypothetical protein